MYSGLKYEGHLGYHAKDWEKVISDKNVLRIDDEKRFLLNSIIHPLDYGIINHGNITESKWRWGNE